MSRKGDTHAPLAERWARYVIMPDVWQLEGCWEWIGPVRQGGYGDLHKGPGDRTHIRAHRFSYEQAFGPIAPGLVIDHLCCNAGCQNPWHMEPVTNVENSRRNNRRFDLTTGEYPCGHPRTLENSTPKAPRRRIRCRTCANKYDPVAWQRAYRQRKQRTGVSVERGESLRIS